MNPFLNKTIDKIFTAHQIFKYIDRPQMAMHFHKRKEEQSPRPMLFAPTTQIYQNQMENEQWRSLQQLLIN